MHAWSTYIQDYLDANRMKPADLARRSGVSPQVISTILNDSRDELSTRPDKRTVDLLALAMGVGPEVLLSKVGEAMGLPVNTPVVVYDASRVSDEDLLRALADRLQARGSGSGGYTAANTRTGGSPVRALYPMRGPVSDPSESVGESPAPEPDRKLVTDMDIDDPDFDFGQADAADDAPDWEREDEEREREP